MKEMSKDIQDLMTLHEVGHALFTTLDMLQESIKRKLDHSFVNVIEDVRIEKSFRTNIEVLSLLSKDIKTLSVWTFLKLMVKILTNTILLIESIFSTNTMKCKVLRR